MTAWSANRLAARAVALHATDPADARRLLDMLGLLDGDRIAPDDCRHYDLARIEARQETHEPNLTRREKGCASPPGLANLTPVAQQDKPKPKRVRPKVGEGRKSRKKPPAEHKRRKEAECSSLSGSQRHRRLGEPECDPCADARREAHRRYDKNRRARLAERKAS